MSGSQTENPTRERGIPRFVVVSVGLIAWLVGVPLAHGVMPWTLSLLTPRYGWTMASPGSWNLLGLIPITTGAVVLAWVLVVGLMRTHELPDKMEGFTSPYLLTRGPYAVTRNPMYVAELALWLGWAILFGSLAVGVGFVGLCLALVLVVPWEERALERRFGDTYRDYRAAVPRWLGKRKPAGGPTRGEADER